MQGRKEFIYMVGDFETTVFDGQTFTEVWASGVCPLHTEDALIFSSIDETFNYLKSLKHHVCIYYHNLKFDGSFWLSYLLKDLHFKQAYKQIGDTTNVIWIDDKDMKNNTFRYTISEMGQWYSITIKVGGYFIEIRDSLKLLPFSIKEIGDSFNTKHKKLEMEYVGYRYAGCTITDEEREYLKNDLFVLKEALEFMFSEGHNKLTIGACCLSEFKKTYDKIDYQNFFPDLTKISLDCDVYGSKTVDEYIRKSYRGGWCYVVKGKENQVKKNGLTADVNSLYPSMMSSESGNRYPVGKPMFWKGNFIPEEALAENIYYFVRIKTRFYLKPNHLPFIQIKGNLMYKGTECLTSSDYYDKNNGKYYKYYRDMGGEVHDTRVELTVTMTDFALITEHYNLLDFEILDGCYFYSEIGLFDSYMEKYKRIKLESKGALRTLAKLFLNNLYGKTASSTDSSFKVAYLKEDNVVGFYNVSANDKTAGYIAIGSAITSYARNFTIRTAQMNYYGVSKRGFIYADTDSIHCDLRPEELKGVKVHDKDFCCWKLESYWDTAVFTRQKTYIEHVTHRDGIAIEEPYYDVKCAGMPKKCKDLFVKSMQLTDKEVENYNKILPEDRTPEEDFLTQKRSLTDFKVGLSVPGKLLPKRILGGILLVDTPYEMR